MAPEETPYRPAVAPAALAVALRSPRKPTRIARAAVMIGRVGHRSGGRGRVSPRMDE
ncbi:MAG: hypothetical protein ABSF83_12380 [Nitrososphaerales archaeon]